MSMKGRYTARDRLAAHLTLLIVFAMLLLSVVALYMIGLFKPVEWAVALSDTKPLEIQTIEQFKAAQAAAKEAEQAEADATQTPESGATQSPAARVLDWLFPSARAEAAPAETAAAGDAAPETGTPTAGADLDALLDDIEAGERETDIAKEDQITVAKTDLAVNKSLPADWFNVLLLATDSRDLTVSNGRTDVMIIASVNAKTGEVKLSSLARDMYVPIPGVPTSNRLNAAFAYGGANLAMKTVNHNFETNIEYYVLVNFNTMAAIIDSLGGVDIPLVGEEYKQINENVAVSEDYEGFAKSSTRRALTADDTEKVVHLDGLQGVGYARIRKIDNDLQRSSRQRILLQAMLDKVMQNATLPTLLNLFNSMSRTTETNLVVTKVMEIGGMLLLADDITITETSLPIAGSYNYSMQTDNKGKEINVLQFNGPQNVQSLHEFIYGEYKPAK